MGTIHDYKNRSTYRDGMPNTVISVAPVKRYAVRYTDSEAKETMCLVETFGEVEDGQLGVFIIANEREMTERLRQPGPKQLAQIRAQIADITPDTHLTVELPMPMPVANATTAFADVVGEDAPEETAEESPDGSEGEVG